MARESNESRYGAWISMALVAAMWPGLWLAWGGARPEPGRRPKLSHMQVSYIRPAGAGVDVFSPAVFPRPGSAGLSLASEDHPSAVRVESDRRLPEKLLPYSEGASPSLALSLTDRLRHRGDSAPGEGLSPVAESPVYSAVSRWPRTNVVVETSASLAACRLEPAPWLFDNGEAVREYEVVSAWVEVDGRGRVTGVLLETPAESAALNQRVVRALWQARVENPGTPCRGLVSVSFFETVPDHGAKGAPTP